MKKFRPIVLLGLGALVLSSCTLVPNDSAPVSVSKTNVPFGLSSSRLPSEANKPASLLVRAIWLVDVDRGLSPASRALKAPAKLEALLTTLLDGPTYEESEIGFTSAVPANIVVYRAPLSTTGVTQIVLSSTMSELTKSARALAFGQLTLTAFDDGARNGVSFVVKGKVIGATLPAGQTSDVVTAKDYTSLTGY